MASTLMALEVPAGHHAACIASVRAASYVLFADPPKAPNRPTARLPEWRPADPTYPLYCRYRHDPHIHPPPIARHLILHCLPKMPSENAYRIVARRYVSSTYSVCRVLSNDIHCLLHVQALAFVSSLWCFGRTSCSCEVSARGPPLPPMISLVVGPRLSRCFVPRVRQLRRKLRQRSLLYLTTRLLTPAQTRR